MAQPVRKVIKEQHPEMDIKPFYTLLIDGNNLLRISMSDTKTNGQGIHYGGIFQFFLQIKLLLRQYPYEYVYVVFDDHKSGILRYKYYHEYKANRDKTYEKDLQEGEMSDYWKKYEETLRNMQKSIYNKAKKVKEKTDKEQIVDENFDRERNIILEYCEELGIRTIFDTETEGDDIIAYYILNKKEEERVVIVSTDNDLTQLISPTVSVYNKQLKKYLSVKNMKEIKGIIPENVALKKIFCGDASDNIGNIKGVSESRFNELVPEIAERIVSIDEVKERAQKLIDERVEAKKKPLQWHENIINGVSNKVYNGDFYEINEKIINLKKPLLTDNCKDIIDSMMYAPIDPEGRSFSNLYNLIVRDNIENLVDSNSFSNFFMEFKTVFDIEVKRYKEWENS